MEIAEIDEQVNAACLDTFGEPVVFFVGGKSRPARAIYEMPIIEIEAGSVPIETPSPLLLMPLQDLQAIGAKVGDLVEVRGRRYQLLEGADDPIVDAGGMAAIPIRPPPAG